MASSRSIISRPTSSSMKRMVPSSTTSAAIWFEASPPWIVVRLHTAVFIGSTERATMDCTAVMAWPAARIGSRVRCGRAA